MQGFLLWINSTCSFLYICNREMLLQSDHNEKCRLYALTWKVHFSHQNETHKSVIMSWMDYYENETENKAAVIVKKKPYGGALHHFDTFHLLISNLLLEFSSHPSVDILKKLLPIKLNLLSCRMI